MPARRPRVPAVRAGRLLGTMEREILQHDSTTRRRRGCARRRARVGRSGVRPATGGPASRGLARGGGSGAQGATRQRAGAARSSSGGRRGGGRHVARRPARRRRGRGGHRHQQNPRRHRRPHEVRRTRAQSAATQPRNQRDRRRSGLWLLAGGAADNFDAREFEVGFQSPLDPYSSTKIFVSFENGNVSIEEGYAYWTGLPGRIRFDIGKFRQQFGEVNRWHLHALPETEYPLALRAYLGDDGLAGTGISLYRAFGGLGVHELTAQLTRSESDGELFGSSGRPTYLIHLLNFWQLTRSTYAQVGGTALYGTNPDSSLRTKVGGIDFRQPWYEGSSPGLYRT